MREGLDHTFRAQNLRTLGVKPGLAHAVLRALDAGTPVLYTARIWARVMLVIRRLPRFLMRRIAF